MQLLFQVDSYLYTFTHLNQVDNVPLKNTVQKSINVQYITFVANYILLQTSRQARRDAAQRIAVSSLFTGYELAESILCQIVLSWLRTVRI